MRSLPLQYRLIVATFLPLVIFALLSGALAAYALRVIPQNLVLQRQTALVQVAAAGVAGNLRANVRLLETTAAELADDADNPARQQQILEERAALLGGFTGGVALLDVEGTALAGTGAATLSVGHNYSFRPYFQEVKVALAPVFSTVMEDIPAGFRAVVIVVPMQTSAGFAGALAGVFALDRREWARDLNLLRTSTGGFAYLVDGASTILYHPDPARIGESIQADPGLWRLVIGGQPQSILHRPAAAAETMVVTFAPIPGIAWGLITEEPWEAILAVARPFQWAASGLLALGMALAFIALAVSVRRVTRPLNALVAEGQRVAAGEPFRPVAVAGPPDVRTLLGVVNQMVARLGEQQAVLRRYALQVLAGQEEERLRLSRDLHDQTVQDLVALTQRLELTADELDTPVAAKARLAGVQELARDTLAEVRRMSRDLRPFVLEDLGLAAALDVLVRDLGAAMPGAHVGCEIVGHATRLSPELELTVYRIAQEALNNVRRHAADATRVNVALFYEDWGVQLMVEDNGRGFVTQDTASLVRDGHLGLAGMAERAKLFGGQMEVTSAPGEGTTVGLRLPSG